MFVLEISGEKRGTQRGGSGDKMSFEGVLSIQWNKTLKSLIFCWKEEATSQRPPAINTPAPFPGGSQQILSIMDYDSIIPGRQTDDCEGDDSGDEMAAAAAEAARHITAAVGQ